MSGEIIEVPLSLLERLVVAVEKLSTPTPQANTLGIEEVATMLGLPVSTVRSHAKLGKLPGAVKRGKHWRFDRARIEASVTGEKVELRRKAGR